MSFLNPLFLIGLSALAIPILIHLVKRERAPKIHFSSLRFLRPISQRTLKYLRLQNLLLMLLRMLALLLMVFAFARPYFRTTTPLPPPKARARALAILVDNSMSMGYADHLARAKRKAAELVDKMNPNDKAFVAAISSRWDQRTQMTSERGVLKSAIDQISLTPNATDYLLTLGAAGSSLLDAETDREKIIYLISDFQKSGLRNDADSHIPSTVALEPYDVAPAGATNLTVAEVDFVKEEKTPEGGKVSVRVVNFGVEKKSITAKLFLNGREIGSQNVTVDKNSAQGVVFEKVALFPGANRGKVELIDDPLPMDNSYFFIIDADRRVKILLVNNSRSPRRESVFVERALGRGGSLPFALTVRTENELKADDVAASHLIIFNEIDKLSDANLKMVRAALEQGKGVLFSVGERVDRATFNRNFSGMAPARLSGIKSARKPERDPLLLTFIKGDHPIFQPFAERHSGNFLASMYSSIFLTEPQPSAAILARYDDGSPALIEAKVGKGLSLLYTSTLGDSWNTLPLNPVYLPMLHQLVKYAASAAQEKNLYVIGETVPIEHILPMAPVDMMSDKILVNDPKGDPLRVVDGLIAIAQPGFYEVKSGSHIKYIAANTSTAESDLRKIDPKELVAAVTKGPAAAPAGAEKSQESVSADTVEKRQSVWWFLLLAALLLFFTETILANRKKG